MDLTICGASPSSLAILLPPLYLPPLSVAPTNDIRPKQLRISIPLERVHRHQHIWRDRLRQALQVHEARVEHVRALAELGRAKGDEEIAPP